jgi:hypothetical protein
MRMVAGASRVAIEKNPVRRAYRDGRYARDNHIPPSPGDQREGIPRETQTVWPIFRRWAKKSSGIEGCRHTLVLERVPPQESIQTYSAITRPRWSRDMYLRSCSTPWEVSICISSPAQRPLWKSNASRIKRTFSVLETTVESAA